MNAMAKDRGTEILYGIQMVNRLKGRLKLGCSGMCKFTFVFFILCLHCSICYCQDAFHSAAKASQEEKNSNGIMPKTPLFLVDGDRFKSLAHNSVEQAKRILGISDSKKNDAFSKPAYKAEDTKNILISLKNEFLSKHMLPGDLAAEESRYIKETPKQHAKESAERLETTVKYIEKTVNHVNHFGTKEVEPETLEIETNGIEKSKFSSEDNRPIIDKSEINGKDKFIHLISKEMRKDHPVSQEGKSRENYDPEKIKENSQVQYLRDFKKQELMNEAVTKKTKPAHLLHQENSEFADTAENYGKLDIFRKRGALTVMEKPLQSYIDDNYEKETAVIQEDSKLNMQSGESVDKMIKGGEGNGNSQDRTVEEAGSGGRPAGTKITLERDIFNVIEERRETIINVTINPARVLPNKPKNLTNNRAESLSRVLNAKEFFTSLPVKNFTLIDKEKMHAFSGETGKIVHDSVAAEKKYPLSHIEPTNTGKSAIINEDDTDQVQNDLKEEEKEAKDHTLDYQEYSGQILGEKNTEHHEDIKQNVKQYTKDLVKKVEISGTDPEITATEVKADWPPEVENEEHPKNVTDSVEVTEVRTGEATAIDKPVEEKFEHEKEPTNTTRMDAKPGEPTEKIKIAPETKPADGSDTDKQNITDTGNRMDELTDTDEKPSDTLETYSQFTQRVNAEKKNDVTTNGHGGNGHGKGPKVKSKNYASPDCGSKLMLANPEASHSSKVIQSNKDEYMLNKCRDKIWFIIELCESIRPQKFDIANFELFSNLPKDIQVSGSHRYPTREWTNLSRTVGQEANRGVQSFPIDIEDFFKYIKVEVLSHYGSEFFCPISLFRIYGLSEFEVIDTIEDSTDHDESEEAFGDPFEEEEAVKKFKDEGKPSVIPAVLKNMFSGVLDVIKRGYRPHSSASEPGDYCHSLHPKFAVDKSRCSMAESVNYILSCYRTEYEVLMQKPVVSSTVKNSSFCRQLASTMCLEPGVNDSIVYDTVCNNSYVCVMLSPKHILAMCYMHDNRIMDAEVECDSSSTHLSENFSATSSDIIPPSDEIPSYVKNAKINTSSITRADALDANASGTLDVQGTKLARDIESEQVLVEQEFQKSNESTAPATTTESSTSETSKPPKKSKSNSSGHQGKSIKEADQKDNITEPEEKLEAEVSSFGGLELEEVEFQQGEELTTPQPAPVAQPPTESKVSSTSPTNKESVVVRLSNKIKALEYNMSISSQYLEELSRRYKRQMEEMQKQFNLTIAALNATSWQAYQRDQQHQKDIETLEDQLASVSNILQKLVDERENLAHTVVEQHLLLMVVEVVVLCVVFILCSRRSSHYTQQSNTLKQERRAQIPTEDSSELRACQDSGCQSFNNRGRSFVRRRSVDSITQERASRQRQRRPSEEALNISGTYQDLLIIEPAIPIMVDSTSDRKKSKKKSSNGTLKRSKSNASIVDKVSSSRRSRHIEKLNISSAGVLFCGDNTVEKDATPPPNKGLSSPDSPDFSGIPYEPFVNEQDQAVFYSGDDYGSYATRSYVTEISSDRQFVSNIDIVTSKRHSIASIQNCDSLNKKGTKHSKSTLVCNAPVKLKSSGEKVKKIKKVKKVKNIVTENLRNGLSNSHCPEALYDHYYYPTTNGTSYSCPSEQHGEYYYGGRTSVHFNDDNHTSHELHYTVEAPSPDSFLNGDSSLVRQDFVGNDFMHSKHDKSASERKKLSPMTKTKVKLRSDNWEWYSAQHFGSSSSETISTCSDSSGRNRKTKTEEELLIVEKSEEKKIKKKRKSKSKASIVLEEEIIPEADAGT